MKKLNTLRVRFSLWTAGLLLAMLVVFAAFVYINTAQNLANAVDNTLNRTATQLISEIDIEHRELVSIERFFAREGNAPLREQGFTLRILDLAGQTIQEYGPYSQFPQPTTSFTTPNQAGIYSTYTDPATGHQVRIYTTLVIEDNRVTGTIQIAHNLITIQKDLRQLLTSLLVGGPLVVVLAGIGGYFLANRALAPIDHMTRTVQRISVEDLSARLNLPSTDDEVGRLASTFDSMLARLDHAFQRERQLTADAAHELRTPLTAMQTILGNTLAQQRTPGEYKQALIDLAEEASRLRKLTEELLFLARSDGHRAASYEPVNLSTLLEDIADSLRPAAKDKGLELVCHIPEGLTLAGDSDSLIRMFVNLLGNAIKYTTQGQITVSPAQTINEFIEIAIADTGIGIAPEHLPHIFDRFYRADKSRATSGAGLGLAIALSIAQAHGGTIQVESEIGEGTVFTVQLAKEALVRR
jgi:heavy metal sensor kinase